MSSKEETDVQKDQNGDDNLEITLIETVLKLEKIDKNLYRADEEHLWRPINGRAVFGGQVVGQALVAAGQTVSDDLHVHSLHCYFVRPGNPDRPILYHVEDLRDGHSFGTRIVKAQQNGENILTMLASYHKLEISPFSHQYSMPVAPPPEDLKSTGELYKMSLDSGMVPEKYVSYVKKLLSLEVPMEMKPVNPEMHVRMLRTGQHPPKTLVWIRAKGLVRDFTGQIHRCIAAYMSDNVLLGTSLLPFHNFDVNFMASLDHSMWFHAIFRADEWMLYEIESPRFIGNRALCLGRLWKRDGTLAVSVAQEGVVRLSKAQTSKL